MMRRFYLLLAIIVSLFCFGYGVAAHAAAYETDSWAYDGITEDGGAGYTHAVVSGSGVHDVWRAESRVDGWELGAKAELWFDQDSMQEYWPSALAIFKQQFLVTAGDVVSTVTFAYDGTLSAAGSNVGSWYRFGAYLLVDHCDENGDWVEDKHGADFFKENGDGYGTWNYEDGFSITYAAGDLTSGDTFFLDVWLSALYEAEGVPPGGSFFDGDGYLDISADFYDSLTLVSVGGGIEAVPIPGAVWLLGSGFLGLVAVRNRGHRRPGQFS